MEKEKPYQPSPGEIKKTETGASPENTDEILVDQLLRKLHEKFGSSLKKEFMMEYMIDKGKIGGKSEKELVEEMNEKNIGIFDRAQSLLDNKERFVTSKEVKDITYITITGEDIGFKDRYTIKEFFDRMQEVGLFKLPAEAGPHYRLTTKTKDAKLIAMEPINNRDDYPSVFSITSDGVRKLWLDTKGANPDSYCSAANLHWVVSLRKLES